VDAAVDLYGLEGWGSSPSERAQLSCGVVSRALISMAGWALPVKLTVRRHAIPLSGRGDRPRLQYLRHRTKGTMTVTR
jgi:hypothetical protein